MLLILLISFIFFLFSLYFFSRDDFVIVRRDIPLERIFNVAILTSFISLIFSRLSFVILSGNNSLLNPLKFFDLLHYQGLSLIGAMLGGAVFTYVYTKYKNMPSGKIFDLFSMSLITAMPVGFLLNYLFTFFKTSLFFNILFIFSILILLIFAKIIFSFSSKGEIEDGSLGLMFLAIFSFLYFTSKLFLNMENFSLVSTENIMLFSLLFSSIILLINREIVDKFLNKK